MPGRIQRALPLLLLPLHLLLIFASPTEGGRPRMLGEPCTEDGLLKCAPGLECALKGTGGKRRCRQQVAGPAGDEAEKTGQNALAEAESASEASALANVERCLRAKCPVLFPDCPSDSVPVLSTGPVLRDSSSSPEEQCCPPALVQCRCDPQKCLVPACPEGTDRVLISKGAGQRPGQCCDHFQCRGGAENQPAGCQHVQCPERAILDLYSPDGQNCPEDSFRPEPSVPSDACCPMPAQCQCRLGICEPARCGPGEQLVVEERGRGQPGHCCDRYKCEGGNGQKVGQAKGGGCKHQGQTFAVGERWHAAPCQECQCTPAGVALCRRMECPPLAAGCQWVGLSPGECCPACLGCRDEQGQSYQIGEHWERDGCTNCTCGADFRWQCQKFICQTQCENPQAVPGECCPHCDEPTIVWEPAPSCPQLADCPLRCMDGLKQDPWTGCFQCQCANLTFANGGMDEAKCQPLSQENCPRMCAHGYLRAENGGCPACRCAHCPPLGACGKQCLHGLETNWMGCQICKCTGGSENDLATTVVMLSSSPESSITTESSSMRCQSSRLALTAERDVGEWWTENCRQCFCQQGKEFCSLLACPARPVDCPEELWLRLEEDCCPRCARHLPLDVHNSSGLTGSPPTTTVPSGSGQQVCHSPGTGQLFVDGQTWHLAEDGCLGCTCRMGHVLCVWNDGRQCPPTPCEHPILDPSLDKCCPRCPSIESSLPPPSDDSPALCMDNSTGTAFPAGAQWRRDECQSCECASNGSVQCHRQRCEAELDCPLAGGSRLLSLKGRCCPICSDYLAHSPTCIYQGAIYAPGEQFQDGPCRNCTCLPGGLLKCVEIHCPSCANGQEEEEGAGHGHHCCPQCQKPVDAEEDVENAILFSSFERGNEQTVFLGPVIGQVDGNGWGQAGGDGFRDVDVTNLTLWLFLLGLVLPMLAFVAFAIGVGCLVVKCRRQKAKWANATNGLEQKKAPPPPVRWPLNFPNRNVQMRQYPATASNGNAGTKLDSTLAAANVSLLRLEKEEEEKLPGNNDVNNS